MTTDVVRVGSRLLQNLAIRLPGAGLDELITIQGISHPTTDGMAVTEGVPAEPFRQWLRDNADYTPVAAGMLFEVPADHDTALQPKEYGFQPALDRWLGDSEQQRLAAEGVPEDPVAATTSNIGMAVPLPNPIPVPPSTVTHRRIVPEPVSVEEVTETVNNPETWQPKRASDDPKQDINLKGAPSFVPGAQPVVQQGKAVSAAPAPAEAASPPVAAPKPALPAATPSAR